MNLPPPRVQAHLTEGAVRLTTSPKAPLQYWGEPVIKERLLKSRCSLSSSQSHTLHTPERELWAAT